MKKQLKVLCKRMADVIERKSSPEAWKEKNHDTALYGKVFLKRKAGRGFWQPRPVSFREDCTDDFLFEKNVGLQFFSVYHARVPKPEKDD